MVGFYGRYNVLMDGKGRIALPAKFRPSTASEKDADGQFMLTKGLDGCLALYPEKEWQLIQERLNTLDFTRKDYRYFSRLLYSVAVPIKLDRQGRLLIPSHLQEQAGLEREILIIGANRWIELWEPDRYEQYLSQYGQSYEDVAERLFDVNRQSKE
ncbi:MAG TPA: division/cell wall cluster transcriptional repressor MraZ [candidate division Zixibacteria bacterium]|nr:division/cell wall cluster transcriptional repressor MraZ [candidate division Zixibacteria bacterium]